MPDDKTNRGVLDRARIKVDEDHDWTQALGVSEEKLREAVAAVGVSADAVRQHLGKPQN